jgi:hypothetical protein
MRRREQHSHSLWLSVVQGYKNLYAMTKYRVQMAVFWDVGKRTDVSKQPPVAILNGQAAGRCHAFTNPHDVTSLNNVIFAQSPQW